VYFCSARIVVTITRAESARAKICLTLRSKYSESRTAASVQENNCIVVMPISLSLSQSALCTPINEVDLHIEFGVRMYSARRVLGMRE
jgi:hypothetical protein